MQLLESWRNSLLLFKPQNISLFLLVTLNAVIKAYQTLVRNFWWIILGYVACEIVSVYCGGQGVAPSHMHIDSNIYEWGKRIAYLWVSFILLLCVRPSLEPYTPSFLAKYWKKSIYYVLLAIGFVFILQISPSLIAKLSLLFNSYFIIASPLFIFIAMFMVDGDGSFRSLYMSCIRGFTMFIYNYPFCLISAIGMFCIYMLWHLGITALALYFPLAGLKAYVWFASMERALFMMMHLLFWVLPLSYFVNFYVKRLHEQFDLYFSR